MRQWYGFSLHPEPDAPSALVTLIRHLATARCDMEFTPEEFRQFRDGLSAAGIDLREIETWTESPHEVVR